MPILIGNILSYLAAVAFVAGLGYRVWLWVRTPAPLRIPTTPAPKTLPGVWLRLLGEIVVFRSLFRANKTLWAAGMVFHTCLLAVVLRHLRYVFVAAPAWIDALSALGTVAAVVLLFAAMFLFSLRLLGQKQRYISTPADYFVLVLIFLVAGTGVVMRHFHRVNLIDVKDFVLSLITLRPTPPPAHPLFLLHICLAFLLIAYFPYSKLLHAGAVVFSPSRYQRDNCRTKAHVNPWDVGGHSA